MTGKSEIDFLCDLYVANSNARKIKWEDLVDEADSTCLEIVLSLAGIQRAVPEIQNMEISLTTLIVRLKNHETTMSPVYLSSDLEKKLLQWLQALSMRSEVSGIEPSYLPHYTTTTSMSSTAVPTATGLAGATFSGKSHRGLSLLDRMKLAASVPSNNVQTGTMSW